MPEKEVEICRRVREFRQSTRLSQVAFAHEIGLDSSALASIEHARAPLRYEIARRIGERFDVCQQWLAKGLKPRKHYVDIEDSLEEVIDPALPFSTVYSKVIYAYVEHRLKEFATEVKRQPADLDDLSRLDSPNEDDIASLLTKSITFNLRTMPPFLQRAYYKAVLARSEDFVKRYGPEIRVFHEGRRLSKEKRG